MSRPESSIPDLEDPLQRTRNALAVLIGKDVYTAFAAHTALFIAVTLYACLMIHLLDQHRRVRQPVC